ncbi:uncharacterized protein LOC124628704 isoform X3 [Ictalurus punctatus]|uniref:Uncharacterized protein LOC124628704 isoform X3 n=1 Tax=Ictalurus punctatus TaxID=7998 RepID=A0A9F7RC22_ICTPU|nr:uncharacterized protein LOC124628704 isoform X3 [Ictalurus punctatus]
MQSCSVHHCVLLLLTLTFTTAPVAAAVCRVQAKLHQRVTLPCEHECPGEAKWTVQRNRDVVFARCDQTSCSSVVKGYEMSHDQYLKGDLSLTITAAEFSMRDTYACECRSIDYAVWRLRIDTVFSAVQKNPGEDLILDLTVPEPVEVIYTSSDSADGERICTVTQHSLQCKAEYTHRASLRYPELTLRDVTHSDSGLYTIRDTENKEDIRVYAVAVTAVISAVQKNPGEDLILDLSVPEPVEVIYTSSDSADGERICNVTQRSLQCKAEYTHRASLRYPELTLRDVTHSDSGLYTIRDTENNEDIRVYAVAVTAPVADAVLPVQAKLHQRVTLPAPVAVADCRVQAKLHQRVTLPCEHECSGEAMWTLKSTRSVFARCDQTSCSSVVKGYEMSHDQYLKGDLSLTITAAEFSMRDTYVCECHSNDYAVWRLRIDTVISAVQKNPGEDLILDLTVPEPVEVIYTSSDSADGERICTVTQHSLQCKAEYTHRASLRYPELTLRDVTHSDSGLYTIRDTENNEDIRVYAVAVTGCKCISSPVAGGDGEVL